MTPKKSCSWIFVILFLVSTGLAGWLYYQNQQLKPQPNQPTTSVTATSPQPSPIKNQETSWSTTKFASFFSYEYPAGWHVAELWQDNYEENGILIAIDPDPINTAPRGGPLATFEITVLNGNPNLDEILQKKMADFNSQNYDDITQETVNTEIGIVNYFKGKIPGEMYQGAAIEKYFFIFQKKPADLINQQAIIATLAFKDNPQLSEMLRHIVLSFKELQ